MKKIYRLKSQKKIAGICAGVADMFGIDPMIVRIIAVFVTVITCLWPGVITYLVAWFLMPAKTELALEEKQDKPIE